MFEVVDEFLNFAESYPLPNFDEYSAGRQAAFPGLNLPYAHPLDRKVADVLNQVPVQHSINNIMNLYTDFAFYDLVRNSVYATPKNYPDIYQVLLKCSEMLKIPLPRMLIHDQQEASAFTAGTDDNCFIVISSYLMRYFSQEELAFVLAHECGHIQNRHVSLRSLVTLMLDGGMYLGGHFPALSVLLLPLKAAIGIPLAAWSRTAEVTADRAGLLVCRDIRVAESALFKLAGGYRDMGQADVDDFIDKKKVVRNEGGIARIKGYLASHPYIDQRIEVLRLFASSKLYSQVIGEYPADSALDTDTMDKKVSEILKM